MKNISKVSVFLSSFITAIITLFLASPVYAAFPGGNGKLVYQEPFGGNIFTIDSDGTNNTNIGTSGVGGLKFSADGTKLTLDQFDGAAIHINTANTDGSGLTPITSSVGFEVNFYPAWSPDGTKIAFTSTRDQALGEIYVMNSDGTNITRLTNNTAQDQHVVWSPDGTKLAFETDRDGNLEVYSMIADGTSAINLTNDAADDTFPDWSPDGSQFVFVSDRNGGSDLFRMNANGSSQVLLVGAPASESNPIWSPDGTKLAYIENNSPNFNLIVANIDGTNPIVLSSSTTLFSLSDWQSLFVQTPTPPSSGGSSGSSGSSTTPGAPNTGLANSNPLWSYMLISSALGISLGGGVISRFRKHSR